jgi:hypothetical protein
MEIDMASSCAGCSPLAHIKTSHKVPVCLEPIVFSPSPASWSRPASDAAYQCVACGNVWLHSNSGWAAQPQMMMRAAA